MTKYWDYIVYLCQSRCRLLANALNAWQYFKNKIIFLGVVEVYTQETVLYRESL